MLKPSIDKGDIKVVGEQYTDGWLPENAQRNMEQILTANNNKVDAVVASNDGTAGGAIAALSAQGLQGIPVSGQDADQAALNRVARGSSDRHRLEGRAGTGQERGGNRGRDGQGNRAREDQGRHEVDRRRQARLSWTPSS